MKTDKELERMALCELNIYVSELHEYYDRAMSLLIQREANEGIEQAKTEED